MDDYRLPGANHGACCVSARGTDSKFSVRHRTTRFCGSDRAVLASGFSLCIVAFAYARDRKPGRFYNLILFALAANALHSNCGNSCAIALQEEYQVLLPSVLILGALLLTSHLSGKALMRQGNNEWHGQALEAILAHPTCEATFGTITDIYFMEEESPWTPGRPIY